MFSEEGMAITKSPRQERAGSVSNSEKGGKAGAEKAKGELGDDVKVGRLQGPQEGVWILF